MANQNPSDEQAFLEAIEAKATEAWSRPVSSGELLHLFDRCPFLVIAEGERSPQEAADLVQDTNKPRSMTSISGWLIHDYGTMLMASPGDLLWSSPEDYVRIVRERAATGHSEASAGEMKTVKGTDFTGKGVGTTVKQAFDTAVDMIDYAIEQKEWSDIFLVDGHPLMQWAAWVEASYNGIDLAGFEPTIEDLAKRDRLGRTFEDLASRIKQRRRPDAGN